MLVSVSLLGSLIVSLVVVFTVAHKYEQHRFGNHVSVPLRGACNALRQIYFRAEAATTVVSGVLTSGTHGPHSSCRASLPFALRMRNALTRCRPSRFEQCLRHVTEL